MKIASYYAIVILTRLDIERRLYFILDMYAGWTTAGIQRWRCTDIVHGQRGRGRPIGRGGWI